MSKAYANASVVGMPAMATGGLGNLGEYVLGVSQQ